jgi:hypothetical protein
MMRFKDSFLHINSKQNHTALTKVRQAQSLVRNKKPQTVAALLKLKIKGLMRPFLTSFI